MFWVVNRHFLFVVEFNFPVAFTTELMPVKLIAVRKINDVEKMCNFLYGIA